MNSPEPANNVYAEWAIPAISPKADPNQDITAGFWVGIDGWGNDQVLQAGVAVTVTSKGLVNWWAWTEWYTVKYKDPAVRIQNFKITGGDKLSVLVCAPQPDHGFVFIKNDSTGQSTSVGIDARPGIKSVGESVEWIVEGASPELPIFYATTFEKCTAGTKSHGYHVQPSGVTTNIAGSAGPLTTTVISGPESVVVDWIGWS
jgi:hypothetical protein